MTDADGRIVEIFKRLHNFFFFFAVKKIWGEVKKKLIRGLVKKIGGIINFFWGGSKKNLEGGSQFYFFKENFLTDPV